jgi:hypothetical protein
MPAADPAKCRDLIAKMDAERGGAIPQDRPAGLKQAVGNVAQIAMRLHAEEAELKRQGCSVGFASGDKWAEPTSAMDAGGSGGSGAQPSFEAGKPMVDVSRDGRR